MLLYGKILCDNFYYITDNVTLLESVVEITE